MNKFKAITEEAKLIFNNEYNYIELFKKNNINFIDLYDDIIDHSKKAEENILENYILGDIHFNKNGNFKIFNAL